MDQTELFGKEKISKILIRLAPRVMLAQPIQALYNIVDSFFCWQIFRLRLNVTVNYLFRSAFNDCSCLASFCQSFAMKR